ncbi:MAG: multiheme c-type cytochrome [Myxococcota bacterium]
MRANPTVAALVLLVACEPAPLPSPTFEDASACGSCHPLQEAEWRGSIMHYAAASPVFNAFELTVQKLTDGRFSPNGDSPNFCNGCHSPTGVYDDEVAPFESVESAEPMRTGLSPVALDGLSCDFCHTIQGPDAQGSLKGDGIANMALFYAPTRVKVGPLERPAPNPYHPSASSAYLQQSAFCGACHDVRLPVPDVLTGEPFQRLENLYSEWLAGPYNGSDNPLGRPVSCQDCHMSLYPVEPPGTYATTAVSRTSPDLLRQHANHAFTAVSIPLVDDPRFPSTHTDAVDDWGYPLGQQARREAMLRAAVTLELSAVPSAIEPGAAELPLELTVTNTGAGHRVPAGFSQEREVWIELVVRDDVGELYASGTLEDHAHPETGELAPDGRLDDEDLRDHHFEIDVDTFATHYVPGPDVDQRPERNLGLVNFQNAFVRVLPDGTQERVLNPLEASSMDNSRSLPILEPVTVRYDVPLPPRELVGAVRIDTRLRYRAFPPEFLRFLAQREPELVSEDTVDRNTIVDMAEASATIAVP